MTKAAELLEREASRWQFRLGSTMQRRRWQGVPGEAIARLSPSDRALLNTLKSDDISQQKLSRDTALMFYTAWDDDRYIEYADFAKFDREVLKIFPIRQKLY